MQKIKKILCATDLSKVSNRLLFWGVELCSLFEASFCIFHAIVPPKGSIARQIEFERGGEKKEKIEKARRKTKKLMAGFDIKWDLIITYGDPVREAAKVAKKTKADLVIAASHGLSIIQQFFIGSVIGSMAQLVSKPLLVIPPGKNVRATGRPGVELKNIVIACSLLNSDQNLKKSALTFSEKFNSKLSLLHIMESPVNEEIVEITSAHYDEVQKRLEEKLLLKLKNFMPGKPVILQGVPGEELSLYAKKNQIDLIIAGVDDHPGRIITTTTAALLKKMPCAVLTVPIPSQ